MISSAEPNFLQKTLSPQYKISSTVVDIFQSIEHSSQYYTDVSQGDTLYGWLTICWKWLHNNLYPWDFEWSFERISLLSANLLLRLSRKTNSQHLSKAWAPKCRFHSHYVFVLTSLQMMRVLKLCKACWVLVNSAWLRDRNMSLGKVERGRLESHAVQIVFLLFSCLNYPNYSLRNTRLCIIACLDYLSSVSSNL